MPSLSGSYPFTYQSLKALVFIHGIQRGTGHGEVPEKSLLCQDAHLPPARRHAEHFSLIAAMVRKNAEEHRGEYSLERKAH